MIEKPPADINPGIVKVVTLLNERGFQTCDSGDGETHMSECDREYGYVVIEAEGNVELFYGADFVIEILRAYGVDVGDGEGQTHVQALYLPIPQKAFIEINYIHDRMLKS